MNLKATNEILLFDSETLDNVWNVEQLDETYALTNYRLVFRKGKDYVVIPYTQFRGYELLNISHNKYKILFYESIGSDSNIHIINLPDEDIIEFNKILSYNICKHERL